MTTAQVRHRSRMSARRRPVRQALAAGGQLPLVAHALLASRLVEQRAQSSAQVCVGRPLGELQADQQRCQLAQRLGQQLAQPDQVVAALEPRHRLALNHLAPGQLARQPLDQRVEP